MAIYVWAITTSIDAERASALVGRDQCLRLIDIRRHDIRRDRSGSTHAFEPGGVSSLSGNHSRRS